MTATAADLGQRRGEYGIDAPYVPLWMGVGAAAGIGVFFAGSAVSVPAIAVPAGYIGLVFLLSVADYVYTSRVGKFDVWAELLLSLDLRGDEHVIDLGCGRGAVLLMVAKLLPWGRGRRRSVEDLRSIGERARRHEAERGARGRRRSRGSPDR